MKHSTRLMIALVVVLGLAPQAAWADPITRSGTYTMEHGGVTRAFRVHLPKGYNSKNPAPLVLIFHGWGGNENEFLGSKTVTSLADKRGYILVAPRGLGSGAPDNSYNSWSFSGS
ncbi:MAG: alpha/beta hydrolase-fold protein, partial [Gammaproteobacteria bacterium]|nr:alpha/beta hydrolase-fold protein [Gammaproteobacteria bacterium]